MLDRFFSALRRLLQYLGLIGREGAPATAGMASASPPPPAPKLESSPAPEKLAPAPRTLGIAQLVANQGTFPVRSGSPPGPALFTLGMIQSFAGAGPIYGAPRANGQTIPLPFNQPLFAIFGTTFGGQGSTSFALPNLVDRVAAGGGFVGEDGPGTLSMTFLIATTPGAAPVGAVMAFGGNYAPDGWAIADGSMLPIRDYVPLFETIGTTFGGDGASVFALPNIDPSQALDGPLTAPLGVGTAPGQLPVALGQRVPGAVGGQVAGLGLNFLISFQGILPTMGSGEFPDRDPYVGQVIAFAGAQAPAGWLACDGSLLPIAQYRPLFQLIGTSYGGDGQTSFALPDLRGRAMTGI